MTDIKEWKRADLYNQYIQIIYKIKWYIKCVSERNPYSYLLLWSPVISCRELTGRLILLCEWDHLPPGHKHLHYVTIVTCHTGSNRDDHKEKWWAGQKNPKRSETGTHPNSRTFPGESEIWLTEKCSYSDQEKSTLTHSMVYVCMVNTASLY